MTLPVRVLACAVVSTGGLAVWAVFRTRVMGKTLPDKLWAWALLWAFLFVLTWVFWFRKQATSHSPRP